MSLENLFSSGSRLSKLCRGFSSRAGEIAVACLDSLRSSSGLIVEEPVEIARMLACLSAAVIFASERKEKVIFSVNSGALQDRLFLRYLPVVSEELGLFPAAVNLKSSDYQCRLKLSSPLLRARDVSGINYSSVKNYFSLNPFHIKFSSSDCISSECPFFEKCYFFSALKMASKADLVVCDHYFCLSVLSFRSGNVSFIGPEEKILPTDQAAFIFDQGKDLVNEARRAFELSIDILSFSILTAPKIERALSCELEQLEKRVLYLFSELESRLVFDEEGFSIWPVENVLLEREKIRELAMDIRKFAGLIPEERRMKFLALSEKLEFLMDAKDENSIFWVEKGCPSISIHSAPLDVAGILREKVFSGKYGIILTGAGLSCERSFGFILNEAGMDCFSTQLFDRHSSVAIEQLPKFFIPLEAGDPGNAEYAILCAKLIEELLEIIDGHTVVLFNSRKDMEKVYQELEVKLRLNGYTVLRRDWCSSLKNFEEKIKEARKAVIFQAAPSGRLEAIPEIRLSLAIITKIPFSSPESPLKKKKLQLLKKQNKKPFLEYQLPEAILILKEMAGQLIRMMDDTGILAILDSRIIRARYGKKILDSLPLFVKVGTVDGLKKSMAEKVQVK